MKFLNKIISFFVGALFIFSGVIKINDPMGTAIKLEEYFEVFAADFAPFFHWFIPISVPLAVFLCVLEVVLGIALLVNFKKRLTVKLLAVLIVFFTFLTFYSAYFDKVTDCGCFGDAIPLTPWQSFTKDVILCVLIGILLFQNKKFGNEASKPALLVTVVGTLASLAIALYALAYIPILDFRDYKVGNNIGELMQPQAACKYEYIMEKDGQEYTFDAYPSDKSYTFKEMNVLNEKECMPKIVDYNVSNEEGDDFTEESISGKKLFIIVHKVDGTAKDSYPAISKLIEDVNQNYPDIEPMILTSDGSNFDAFRHEVQLAAPYYYSDATVLKAVIRSNPGVLLLEDGVVKGKWAHRNVPDTEELINKL
ncbi:MAG: DoxX family protein [Thalassobius sp.]|nr:DoxX family protein [Thalassovita sp.]